MTRDEAVARVQFHLGRRTDLASDIIKEMQQEQILLEQKAELPWFLLTEVSEATATVEEERVPFPTDFIRQYEGDALYIYTSSAEEDQKWSPLTKYDIVYCRANFPGAAEKPLAYAVDGKYFRLFPRPSVAVVLKMIYYAGDDLLTTNIENLWLRHAPDLLIGAAGAKVATISRPDAIPIFQAMRQNAENALDMENEVRQHEKQRYIIGGED